MAGLMDGKRQTGKRQVEIKIFNSRSKQRQEQGCTLLIISFETKRAGYNPALAISIVYFTIARISSFFTSKYSLSPDFISLPEYFE